MRRYNLDTILVFYDQIPSMAELDLQKNMEENGWEIDIDRAGEQGEHEIRFRKAAFRARASGNARVGAMRKAAQAALRDEIGPAKCFTLGLI
jgi:hypothetical protein